MMRNRGRMSLLIGVGAASAATLLVLSASAAPRADARYTEPTAGRLFFLGMRHRVVYSANPDGSGLRVVVKGVKGLSDGIAVDWAGRHIYWTNMVTRDPAITSTAGSVQRADLDGMQRTTIIPIGGTFRPKQMILDKGHGKIYWSDREGMRVMRANLDGSDIETLIQTGHPNGDHGDARNYCVGIALDLAHGQIYWTQRGNDTDQSADGSIRRANIDVPKGETAANRSDIQVLFDGLPEPVDLAFDLRTRMMYWTSDGGLAPRGNTVSRAPMDPPHGVRPKERTDQQVLVHGLQRGIGISLDLEHGRMYFADLGGHVYSANLDGSDKRVLLSDVGPVTGITFVRTTR